MCSFYDGNDCVGSLIGLKYNTVPFVIEDNLKMFYYRELKECNSHAGLHPRLCLKIFHGKPQARVL